jgi:hypothetical protein
MVLVCVAYLYLSSHHLRDGLSTATVAHTAVAQDRSRANSCILKFFSSVYSVMSDRRSPSSFCEFLLRLNSTLTAHTNSDDSGAA